ncbi:MAG: hypothetical protein V3V68_04930 [Nitrosomonadaceae bacterium]
MKRRDFLTTALAAPLLIRAPGQSFNDGWIPESSGSSPPRFKEWRRLVNFGQNKVACLWKPYEQVTKESWVPRKQLGPDCVAFATGTAMDILTAVQIILKGKRERFLAMSSTDMIYTGGRKLIAKQRSLGGMRAEWCVEYLKSYGNLLRQEYGEYDLTPYTKTTLKTWFSKGIPKELLVTAKEHPLLESAQVRSWEEFRDAIAAGYPIVFCATLGGGNSRRDKDGFIKPSRQKWYHSWCGAGIIDGKRPGALLINSHGKHYGSGPKTHGQPDGSVWIDAKHIDKQCRNFGDTYALSLYRGFPKPEEKYILW